MSIDELQELLGRTVTKEEFRQWHGIGITAIEAEKLRRLWRHNARMQKIGGRLKAGETFRKPCGCKKDRPKT